jgi:hypothetical protein
MIKTTLKLILYGFMLLLLCDYILAEGGYRTIFIHLLPAHPIFFYLPVISVPAISLWLGFKALILALNRKWKYLSLFILCIVLVIGGSRITIKVLSDRSEKKAFELVSLVLTGKTDKFIISIDKDTENTYQSFLPEFDPSAIRIEYAFPPHGRYDFLITPKSSKPFYLTLWVNNSGGRILIHGSGLKK